MRTLSGSMLVLIIAGSTAQAQDAKPGAPDTATATSTSVATPPQPGAPAQEAPRPHAQLTLRGEHTFDADLKDSPGSVGIDRAGADLLLRFPIGNRSRLSAALGTEYSFYDFQNATGFAAGFTEPWDDTLEMNASVTFSTQATRQWAWYVGGGIDESVQSGADYADGITGGVFGGVNYGISERLSVGLGLILRTRLEDDGQVLPIPSIDWQISDKWKLGTHSGVSGTGLALSYQPLEQLTLSLEGAYQTREYRLNDSAAAPEGVGRDHRIPISLAAQWNISRMIAVSGHVGVDAYQEYTLIDSGGTELSNIKTKPAVFVGASVVFSF